MRRAMDVDAIKKEYLKRRVRYGKLKEEILYIIEGELKKVHIPYHTIEGRVKTLDSLIAKVERKSEEGAIDRLDEIVDICGVRIICLFLSDIDKIGKIVEEKFKIRSKDDKILSKPQEEFGYFSAHYVCTLPESFSGPRYDELKGLKFEVQVRTIAMHAWSTVSHYLDYKSSISVPSIIRKDFYALSGLFYLADSHFELFFRNSQQSRQRVEQKGHKIGNIQGEEINFDTLATYLKRKFPNRKRGGTVGISNLVEELISSEYSTVAEIDRDIERSKVAFKHYEKDYPPVGDKGYSDLGVVRISLSIANKRFLNKRRKKPSSTLCRRYRALRKYLK